MMKLASYMDPVEAEMAAEYLRSNDITAEVAGGTDVSVFGAGHPLSAQFLLVEAAQFGEARSLLASRGSTPSPAEPAAETKPLDGYYETSWNERERAAESAYRSSVIGWFVPFVSWWGAWHLARVLTSDLPLNSRCARRAKIAAAILAIPATLWVIVLVIFVRT